jgi:protein ImuA
MMEDFSSHSPSDPVVRTATLRQLALQLRKMERRRLSSRSSANRPQNSAPENPPPKNLAAKNLAAKNLTPKNLTGEDRGGTISSGIEALDRLLPNAGFRGGTLVEWLADSGADQLALLAARPALRSDGFLIVIDCEKTFYPPGAAPLGIDLRRLILVRPDKVAEAWWALEQSLRSRGVALTFCRLQRLSARVFRRLQLAAERGGGLGFLIRPPSARREPSWSDVRLGLLPVCEASASSFKRQWRVEVLRCRGKAGQQSLLLEYDDATNLVHPVSEPPSTTFRKRAAGA